MIGWLRGAVRARDPAGTIVLETAGVGYEVLVSLQTMAEVPEVGGSCELFVHTYVREDKLSLYGFASDEERRLFRLLTSVPKVGPSNARSVLGGFPVRELVECLHGEDQGKLTKIPGIGKRTAEQIFLTLRGKLEPIIDSVGITGGALVTETDTPGNERLKEARSVLVSLGWKPKPVEKALTDLELPDDASLDEIVRGTLARLMDR